MVSGLGLSNKLLKIYIYIASSLQETYKKQNNNIYIDLFPFFMTVGTLDNVNVQQIFKMCNMK